MSGVNYATPTPREDDPDYNYHDKLERGAPGTSTGTGSATGTRAARGLGVEAAYHQPAPTPLAEYVGALGRRRSDLPINGVV